MIVHKQPDQSSQHDGKTDQTRSKALGKLNLLLAFFNLVPVPPLDGGNVLAGLLPEGAEPLFAMLRQYGFIILYVLMLTGVLSYIVLPPTWLFRSALQIPPSQVFEGVLYQ